MAENGDVVSYCGKDKIKKWTLAGPSRNGWADGTKLKATVIDTWNMTSYEVPETFVTKKSKQYEIMDEKGRKINLKNSPYMAVILSVVD